MCGLKSFVVSGKVLLYEFEIVVIVGDCSGSVVWVEVV